MQVHQIMTSDVACCTPETPLREAARMMAQNDCGALPVVESANSMRLAGIITDRDIACRGLLHERSPLDLSVSDCMTPKVQTVSSDADVRDAEKLMQQHQIRRIPVVDGGSECCGMVSQADLALNAEGQEVASVLRDVSQPVRQIPAHQT
jgi:CBS domain-containing protein